MGLRYPHITIKDVFSVHALTGAHQDNSKLLILGFTLNTSCDREISRLTLVFKKNSQASTVHHRLFYTP
jgi:hypothetical protein